MKSLYNRLDHSKTLSKLITGLSHGLASRRGIPVLTAIVLAVIALVINLFWVLTDNKFLGICGISLLHFAVFIGFLGVLLAEPLGRG